MKIFKPLTALALGALFLAAPVFAQTVTNVSQTQAGAYKVEPYHTRVLFSVSHMGFSTWYGEFTNVSGSLNFDPKAVGKSSLQIHIPTATISTSNVKLDGELKSPVWFDATKYPDIAFTATKITKTGKNTAKIVGDLTFHGVTKPVTLLAKFHGGGTNIMDKAYTVGFDATGSLKRSDFGVKTYVPLIGDDVGLIISAAFEQK